MVDIHEVKVGTLAPHLFPFDQSVQSVKGIEGAGYDSMWYVDHLMGLFPEAIWTPDITPLARFVNSPHTYPDPFTLMAAHATQTNKILLGVSVTETIRRHPAILAQTALTLDHISKGRTIIGVGAGEIENIEPYGLDFSKTFSRLEENLRIIRLLWSDQLKKKTFQGKFTSLKDAVLALEPYKKGKYPPIWLGAMRPKMLRLTGELADGWIPASLNLPRLDETYKKNVNTIRESAKKAGRDPDSLTASLYAFVFAAKTHEECHEMFKKPMAKAWALATSQEVFDVAKIKHPLSTPNRKFSVLTQYIPTRYSRAQILEAINKVPEEVLEYCPIHGTRDEIIEKVEKLARAGLQHIIMCDMTAFADPTKIIESAEILGNVLKYIKGH
nr:LLM class flavin-dependent oxidoreductase [Candidatus Freyarchaeota archaeon]